MQINESLSAARDLAQAMLAEPLPRRWRHVQAVAAEASRIAQVFGRDGHVLVTAAWLHDVGYNEDLSETGFHPIDGARFLRRKGWPERVYSLVAHHSYAACEATLRELVPSIDEFVDEGTPIRDALWYCDLTTGPSGERFAVEERLREIVERYGPESIVTRFVQTARTDLVAAVDRTLARIGRDRPILLELTG